MIRRRRNAISARAAWVNGPAAPLARFANSQPMMAAITPRVARIVELLDLRPGRSYLDVGCGTASLAHLIASQAGLKFPPVCVDLVGQSSMVDALAWPEQLPFRDGSFDAITSLYFLRRLDDDQTQGFAGEIARVLAPGGSALAVEVAPVKSPWLNRLHTRLLSAGCPQADLRGWARLAALFTECGFDALDLVNTGPFLLPPIPRVGVLMRKAPGVPTASIPAVEPGLGAGNGWGGETHP